MPKSVCETGPKAPHLAPNAPLEITTRQFLNRNMTLTRSFDFAGLLLTPDRPGRPSNRSIRRPRATRPAATRQSVTRPAAARQAAARQAAARQAAARQAGTHPANTRRGAATVELAFLAPLFVMIALGVSELGRAVNATSHLTAAIREAGRLACMDFDDLIPTGMDANQKIENDIRAFLNATGMPGDGATITITHADGPNAGTTFDLSSSENYLELFRIDASLPYSAVSVVPLSFMEDNPISATIVFRRGRVNMSQ